MRVPRVIHHTQSATPNMLPAYAGPQATQQGIRPAPAISGPSVDRPVNTQASLTRTVSAAVELAPAAQPRVLPLRAEGESGATQRGQVRDRFRNVGSQQILYGVVGEGMGHATRSRVIIEHLLKLGHQVRVVVSGRAHGFLREQFKDHPHLTVNEIHGLTLSYANNVISKRRSVKKNLEDAPKGLLKNIREYARVAREGFEPDLVISDFESWAYLFGLNHRIPVVSIDNMQVINRCAHDAEIRRKKDFQIAKLAVKAKLPWASHYLVTSFFFPRVRKERTTLVPPILRPAILEAQREPGDHILVYQTADTNRELIPALRRLPHQFRVYGMGEGEAEGNVIRCGFSQTGFVHDLRTARAVIAGGGFSLMSEAVFLKVPFLSIPIQGQFEQELNARYLARLGYGAWSDHLDLEVMEGFIAGIDEYAQALNASPQMDPEMTLACLEELIFRISQGDTNPVTLTSPSMGGYKPS